MHGAASTFIATCRRACTAALLLALPVGAGAAPWRDHVTLPSGDVVQVRTEGRALKPSGSRAEVDLPVRLRFATPVPTPVGPVALADATVRVLCQERSVSAKTVVPRNAAAGAFVAKDRKVALLAVQAPLQAALNAPAFTGVICGA